MALKRKPYFFDNQINRYLLQIMATLFSGWQVRTGTQRDGKERMRDVPVVYGSMSRAVGRILGPDGTGNSTSYLPMISVYKTGLAQSDLHRQNPQHVEKFSYVERARDANGKPIRGEPGRHKTVERHMPVPYIMDFAVSIWGSNEFEVQQIVEQLGVIFNPEVDIQLSNSPADWSFLSTVHFSGSFDDERVTPTGTGVDELYVTTMNFNIQPVYLSPPVKVYDTKYIHSVHVPIKELEDSLDFDDMTALDNLVIRASDEEINEQSQGTYEL